MNWARTIWLALALLSLSACQAREEYPVVGTVERHRLTLTAEQTEPVIAVHVREGQRVEAGTVLMEQDSQRSGVELQRLQAAADRARHRLDELLRGPRQEAIDEARARLLAAESALAVASSELHRVASLQARDMASRSALDAAQNARDQAQGQYDATRSALAALLEGTTVEELDQARAALREAEAAVAQQQISGRRLTTLAPRAARVEAILLREGETPRSGDPLLVLQVADQPPHARVYVPTALHASFRPGQMIPMSVEGYGERLGEVRYLAAEASFTPFFALTEHDVGRLSYRVEIDLQDADDVPSGVPVRALVPASAAGAVNE